MNEFDQEQSLSKSKIGNAHSFEGGSIEMVSSARARESRYSKMYVARGKILCLTAKQGSWLKN